ncbi:energy transducer TonB [Acidithiobacillus sp. AMEEHan]|uniref:energy transducer TonB n=1 Tax=Acidithiobacillus sp. AMEEHan TaxID=2994951 RepID=UPI0027E4AB21|nr:energy transducer TonB [Acidithiobacillus sp. AMEEHan]
MSVSSPFYFLVPEGKPHWSDSLLPWIVPATLLIALLLFLLLYQHPPKHLALQGKQERYKTFQIMPEPTRPAAPSRPARAQSAVPIPHVQARPLPRPTARPQAPARPRPHPARPVPRPPRSQVAPLVPAAPSQPAAAPSTASPSHSIPHINLGRLQEQMDNAARSATAAPALPKFHNPETPAADFYIAGWIQKLERIGDLNYPGQMVGNLKVKVVLNPEGGLQRIIMVHSSGNPKLDAAAEQIIRLSFPYTAFSEQLKKETRRIEIPLNMHFLGVRQVNVW